MMYDLHIQTAIDGGGFIPVPQTPAPEPLRTKDAVRHVRKRVEATPFDDVREVADEWRALQKAVEKKVSGSLPPEPQEVPYGM